MIIPFQKFGKSIPNMRSAAPVAGRPWSGSVIAIAWLGLLVMGGAQAIDIPALPVVQPNIAAVNPALVQQRETLIKERKALLDRTNSHNSMCGAVEAGSAADASCTKAYPSLEAEIKNHVQVSKQYNTSLQAAISLAASQKPAPPPPHTDTSVVDGRNVPSGLPKDVDNAIAKAYASAPPGVSVRVRKGFQAVMDRDWKVAKAWFQDALNRDPNNTGLQRLVALADSPQQANTKHTGAVDDRNEPAGLGGKSNFKGAFATPGQVKLAPGTTTAPQTQQPATFWEDQVFDLLVRNTELKQMLEKQRTK